MGASVCGRSTTASVDGEADGVARGGEGRSRPRQSSAPEARPPNRGGDCFRGLVDTAPLRTKMMIRLVVLAALASAQNIFERFGNGIRRATTGGGRRLDDVESYSPTANPTSSPSYEPTSSTYEPTSSTYEPTSNPTYSPSTADPSYAPTNPHPTTPFPTPRPSDAPTPRPSAVSSKPTYGDGEVPIMSDFPTPLPTDQPTHSPSSKPTTSKPTFSPQPSSIRKLDDNGLTLEYITVGAGESQRVM